MQSVTLIVRPNVIDAKNIGKPAVAVCDRKQVYMFMDNILFDYSQSTTHETSSAIHFPQSWPYDPDIDPT
jgi:hypothetical protein